MTKKLLIQINSKIISL